MKTLVITSCCKRKLPHEARAGDLYQGNLFKAAKNFADRKGYDLVIISARYGLISPSEVMKPYDKVLKTKEDIESIKPQVVSALSKILPEYKRIIVICGKNYRKTIEQLVDGRFEIVTSPGYGSFVKKVNEMR